ncbi:unnamed protein product [Calicophoron daubneyi]|uniref:Inhibitor of apoptosis protein n=1 Tax=Calicophoron daubneyi TaxID=300641 RepID=A0AAV2TK40_CALDB
MNCFQSLCSALEETFAATTQSEDELSYASATLILSGLLQIHSRTPRYASHRARLESFADQAPRTTSDHSQRRPVSPPRPSPNELATAGFFHTGSGDETVCPACGLGLRDWQSTDQPEACHLAYSSTGIGLNATHLHEGVDHPSTPALPCLYLAVHRLLVSEIPLARKCLIPAGPAQSVCALPGIITPPTTGSENACDDFVATFPSLADRLLAITQIMMSPPSPQGWPVENARALGHSDDLIVLALWRLQSESAGSGLACPPTTALRLDPQGTTDLLKAILRVQEGFDATSHDFPDFEPGVLGDAQDDDVSHVDGFLSDTELTEEDAETAALSRCRCIRVRSTAGMSFDTVSPRSYDSSGVPVKRIRLPHFYQFLLWWYNTWFRKNVVSDAYDLSK